MHRGRFALRLDAAIWQAIQMPEVRILKIKTWKSFEKVPFLLIRSARCCGTMRSGLLLKNATGLARQASQPSRVAFARQLAASSRSYRATKTASYSASSATSASAAQWVEHIDLCNVQTASFAKGDAPEGSPAAAFCLGMNAERFGVLQMFPEYNESEKHIEAGGG